MSGDNRSDSGSTDSGRSAGKQKWKSAFRVVQGFNRFKTVLTPKHAPPPETKSKSEKKLSVAQKPSEDEGDVDPIYLAIKQASLMWNKEKPPGPPAPGAPRKHSVGNMPQDSSAYSLGTDSGYGGGDTASSSKYSGSTPVLRTQHSTELMEDDSAPLPSVPTVGRRRAPKLNHKMKSLSLDCPEATDTGRYGSPSRYRRGNPPHGLSPRRGAHLAPPRRMLNKNSSLETSTDDTEPRSSTSCSPCPSPHAGSTSSIPSGSLYAVVHEYHAKFPEELDLRLGERIIVLDTTDPEWYSGYRLSDRESGMFPCTCVASASAKEVVLKVLANLNLSDGNKVLRLYRDQIVFGLQPSEEGMSLIRTERGLMALCPTQYLKHLD